MRQKRPAPGTILPTDIHIPAHFLDARAKEQDAGATFYGQAIYSPAKRARCCHARSCFPFLDCYQGEKRRIVLLSGRAPTAFESTCGADPVPAPPEPAAPLHGLGYFGSSFKGSGDMDRVSGLAIPFSKEEDKYVRSHVHAAWLMCI